MTSPLRNVIEIEGRRWLVFGDDGSDVVSALFDIKPTGRSTACHRGWFLDFAVRDDRVVLDAIHTYGGTVSARTTPATSVPTSAAVSVTASSSVTLSAPEDEAGHTKIWRMALPLELSGTWAVGHHASGDEHRQAMRMDDRHDLVLDHGRVVSFTPRPRVSLWRALFG